MPTWETACCQQCDVNSPIIKSGELNHLPIYNDERSYQLYIKKMKKVGILFKFRGRLIYSKNILLILQCFIFLKFKFFSFTTEFE